jgi:hypothetical protein
VIWSDSLGLALPGYPEIFAGTVQDPETGLYHQQVPGNVWQAESYTAPPPTPFFVSEVDWGDNLEAKSWPSNTVLLRVETVLYKVLSDPAAPGTPLDPPLPPTMTAFQMIKVDESVFGPDEVWGTTSLTYESNEATVYTPFASVLVHAIPVGVNPELLVWSAAYGWSNPEAPSALQPALLNSEPAGAEVNVQGKVVFGYNWNVAEMLAFYGLGPGTYRITFSLGDSPNTSLANAVVRLPDEETADANAGGPPDGKGNGGGGPPDGKGKQTGGGTAVVDNLNNLTYIDVTLTKPRGGGKR